MVLSLSGLAYLAPSFFILTECGFRLGWWAVLVTIALPLALLIPAPTGDRRAADCGSAAGTAS